MTRSELEDRICVLLGGRVAEELVYGEVSTGAHNDLERATDLARLMVMKYGMSERVGLATYGERVPQFLKGQAGWGGERDFSEDTARAIDAEVRELLDRLHDRVRGILTTKKAALMAGAAELKQVETLEGERLRRVLAAEGGDGAVAASSREAGR
jgi:cell division protease FtsH